MNIENIEYVPQQKLKVLDSYSNKWKPAIIREIDHKNHQVCIHYVGYSSQFDEIIDFDQCTDRFRQDGCDDSIISTLSNANTKHCVPGFRNMLNTCFISAALQLLMQCVDLNLFFLKAKTQQDIGNNNSNTEEFVSVYEINDQYVNHIHASNKMGYQGRMAHAFANIAKQYWTQQNSTIDISNFKQVIGQCQSQYDNSDQQDAQEFIAFVLDALHEDLKSAVKTNSNDIHVSGSDSGDKHCTNDIKSLVNEQQNTNQSIITDLFQGQFKSTLKCTQCGYHSTTYESYYMLSLPIPSTTEIRKNTIILNVFVYNYLYQHTPYQRIQIDTDNRHTIRQFLQKVAKHLNIADKTNQLLLVVCNANHSEVYRIFRNPDTKNMAEVMDDVHNRYPDSVCHVYVLEHIIYKEISLRPIQFDMMPFAVLNSPFDGCTAQVQQSSSSSFFCFETPGIVLLPFDISQCNSGVFSIPLRIIQEQMKSVVQYFATRSCLKNQYSRLRISCINKAPHPHCGCTSSPTCNQIHFIPFSNGQVCMPFQQENEYHNVQEITLSLNINAFCYCMFILWWSEPQMSFNQASLYKRIYYNANNEEVENIPPVNLEDCINAFVAPETVQGDNAWYCTTCKILQNAVKNITICKYPKYLFLHLKRFVYTSTSHSKNSEKVRIPLHALDLSQCANGGNTKPVASNYYKCIGIVCHSGGLYEGHYTSFTRHMTNDCWYYEDDENTQQLIDFKDYDDSSAYVLLYQKI